MATLATAVIPQVAGLAAGGGLHGAEEGSDEKAAQFGFAVEVEFAGGRDERVAMQDDAALPVAAGDLCLESQGEVDLFSREELQVEATHFAKRCGAHEDERTRDQAPETADGIPKTAGDPDCQRRLVERDRRAREKHVGAARDECGNIGQEFSGWL